MRKAILAGILVGLSVIGLGAQGPFSAQIQQFYQFLQTSPQRMTGTWTFNDIVVIGSCTGCGGGGGIPGGSTTQVQYNNAGAFGGISGATSDGTAVTLTLPIFVAPTLGVASGTRLGLGGAADSTAALKSVGQYYSPLVADGNSSTAQTINWDLGNEHLSTLTGDVTYTLSNPKDGGRYVLLMATGAGGFTVTWPATVLWPGGVAPTITVTASKVDLCTFIYASTAGKYYGACNQNY